MRINALTKRFVMQELVADTLNSFQNTEGLYMELVFITEKIGHHVLSYHATYITSYTRISLDRMAI